MLTISNYIIFENTQHSKIKGADIIQKFGLSPDDYIIFGSGSMVAHGLLDTNADIDMYVRPEKFNKLVKEGKLKKFTKYGGKITYYADPTGMVDCAPELLIGGNKSVEWWFKHSEVIDGIRVLTIDGLKFFYKQLYKDLGQEKHKQRLEILKKL